MNNLFTNIKKYIIEYFYEIIKMLNKIFSQKQGV